MKYALVPAVLAFSLLTSCKKDSPPPPGYTGNPNNELKATVSVIGEATTLHQSNGASTLFARNIHPNGDTIIVVSGSTGKYGTPSSRKIEIWLQNTTGAGTYKLNADNINNPRQKAWCVYIVGDVFFSTIFEMYFSDRSTAPGNVTVDLLTPTEIRGTFSANCSNPVRTGPGVDYAQITAGSFKGTFE